MREIVLELPVKYTDGTEEKIYIKVFADCDFGNIITTVDKPRVLSDKERCGIGL